MRKHNGMRPQDIAILLKIVSLGDSPWNIAELSHQLKISISEISESLNRSMLAGLIDHRKKKVNRLNLIEFLEHGFKYVFPQQPGAMVRGVPTAHAHPLIKEKFISDMDYVWPDPKGGIIGLTIEPLYQRQVEAIGEDGDLYMFLALLDMIRAGKAREVKYAVNELKEAFLNERSYKQGQN
jgi:hypothetical protein